MHEIIFYGDRSGVEPVKEYIRSLTPKEGEEEKDTKDKRIKRNKILDYIKLLSEHGTQLGLPYVDHLDGEIWELRPLRDRILFAAAVGGRFVLLHTFMKQTKKTPKREIEQAKRELADFIERGGNNG